MSTTADIDALATLEGRDVRALTQPMDVYPNDPDAAAPWEVAVYHGGEQYVVNTEVGFCPCPDAHYRGAECKHLRRVAFEVGDREIPAGIDRAALDRPLRSD
jgi:predicted nucleic acid-binding Zn finger protein